MGKPLVTQASQPGCRVSTCLVRGHYEFADAIDPTTSSTIKSPLNRLDDPGRCAPLDSSRAATGPRRLGFAVLPRRRNPKTEDALTEALVLDLLANSPPAAVERFAAEVCGVGDLGPVRKLDVQVPYSDLAAERGIVVGLAPERGVAPADRNISGKAIVDGLICGQTTAILLEAKVRGRCEQGQLVRHALYWALDVDRDKPVWDAEQAVPPGYALTSWTAVAAWVARERARGECDPDRLDAFAAKLGTTVALDPAATAEPPRAAPVGIVRRPDPVPLAEIRAAFDLPLVYDLCAAYIAHSPVSASDCLADTLRMRSAFEAAGLRAPAGLRWHGPQGAMTPLRVLTAMYRGESLSDAWPESWTGWWMRVLDRGGDQVALASMLAWGLQQRGARRENTVRNVPIVWGLARDHSPGLEALRAAAAPAAR